MKRIRIPKRSAYPTKIYYQSECYKVKFKRNLDCFGKTDGNRKEIVIKANLSARETMATLVHELLHVIEFETPIKLKHKNIYKLERAIVDMLLDNFL